MEDIVCYFDRLPNQDASGLWFYNRRELAVATICDGRLWWEDAEPSAFTPPALILNGRWEAPALQAALANTPTTDVWKARYEEAQTVIARAEERVDKLIGKFLG